MTFAAGEPRAPARFRLAVRWFCGVLLAAGLATAAPALPLQDAVRLGTERDATVASLQQAIARETTNVEIAKDGRRPQLSVTGSSNTADDDAALVVTITQVLIDWGMVKSQIAKASSERVKVVAELKMAVEALTLDISTLYIEVEILDRKIARTSDYVAFATRLERLSRDRVAAGLANSAEIARARLEISRAEQRMFQLTSEREITLSQLEFIVGQPVGNPKPAPALGFADKFSSSAAVIAAVSIAPAYTAAKADVDIAEAGIKAAKAATKPKISLQAQGRQDLTGGRGRSGAIGITTGVDLNGSVLRGRATTAAKQDHAAAKARLLAVERELQNAIRVYVQQLQVLSADVEAQQQQLDQAREVLAAYEQQFIAGQRDLVDLLSTGRDMYEAEIDEIETYRERKQTEYTAAHDIGVLGSLLFAARR